MVMKRHFQISILAAPLFIAACTLADLRAPKTTPSQGDNEFPATPHIQPTPQPGATQSPTSSPPSRSNQATTPDAFVTPTADFLVTPRPTRTPASAAQCPPEISAPPSFDRLDANLTWWERDASASPEKIAREFRIAILELLDAGAASSLVERLQAEYSLGADYLWVEDLTNDGVPELVISDWNVPILGSLYVFGCAAGRWQILLVEEPAYDWAPRIRAVMDVNANGVSDLVVEETSCHYCTAVRVYEWTGTSFEGLIRDWKLWSIDGEPTETDFAELDGYSRSTVEDNDSDGFYEIILSGGIPSYPGGFGGAEGPYREQTVIYKWTGSHYQFYSRTFADADFRYQAIQDGDRAAEQGNYAGALALYEQAISDKSLKSWSPEAWDELLAPGDLAYPDISLMPYNETEHAQLAAYARYRIMLVYLEQGQDEAALDVYDALVALTPESSPAYPYRELADTTWSRFQSTARIELACAAAIQFTTDHPEILSPVSADEYRSWDDRYTPEMVCPFHDNQ